MKRKTVPSFFLIFFVIPFFVLVALKGTVYTAFAYNSLVIVCFLLLFTFFCIYNIKRKKRIILPSLIFPVFFMILLSLISLVPLPAGIIKNISPLAFFFNSASDNSLSRLTLSLPDTVYTIFRVLVFLIFMTISARIMGKDAVEERIKIFFTVAFVGALNVFISLPYYIDKESFYFLREIIPFINPNHFGGFSGLAAFASLTFISNAKKDSGSEKILYFGVALFIVNVSGLLLSLSRGSIVAFVFSMFFILIFKIVRKRHSDITKTKRTIIVVFTSFFLLLVFLSAHNLIEKELVFSNLSPTEKLEKASGIKDYFKDFIITGSGAGSFRHVHSFYSATPEKQFLQLENEPVQLILETGLLPAFLFFVFLIYILIKRRKKQLHSKEVYYAALFFISIQNFVDFNLHNLSNLVVAGLFYITVTDSYIIRNRFRWKAYLIPAMTVLIVILFFTLPFSFDLKVNMKEHKSSLRKLYPSSYLIPMTDALMLINSGDKKNLLKAVPFLSETMAKAPKYIFPNLLTGVVFFRMGDRETSLNYFRKAISKEDESYHNNFNIVFNELKNRNKLEFLGEIIDDIKITDKLLNSLISKEISPEKLYKITEKRKMELFIPFCKAALMLNKVDECSLAADLALKSKVSRTIKEKGEIDIIQSQIADRKKNREKALEYARSGALKTGNFFHYLYLYRLYVKYGLYSEISSVESELRKQAMTDRKLYSYFLKAKSDALAYDKRFYESVEQLENALLINKNPEWQYICAERLYLAGDVSRAAVALSKIAENNDKKLKLKIEKLKIRLNTVKKTRKNQLMKRIMETKHE